MKKRINAFAAAFFAAVLFSAATPVISHYVSGYKTSNPSYMAVETDNSLNLMDDYKTEQSISQTETKIKSTEENISSLRGQYNNVNRTSDSESLTTSIQEQQTSLYQLKQQRVGLILEKELNDAYKNCSDKFVVNQQRSLEYRMLKKLNDVAVLEKNIEYCKSLESYEEENLKAAKAMFSEGYAKEADVADAEAKLLNAEYNTVAAQNKRTAFIYDIEANGETYTAQELSHSYLSYSANEFSELFLADNPKTAYSEAQIFAYENYIRNLEYLLSEMNYSGCSHESFNVLRSGVPNEIEYTKKKIEKIRLDIEQNRIDTKVYALTLAKEFETLNSQLKAAEADIIAAEQKLSVAQALLNEGQAKPADVLSSTASVCEKKYIRETILAKMKNIEFLLDNKVEGETF